MIETSLGPEHKPTRIINYEETAQSRLFCNQISRAEWGSFLASKAGVVRSAFDAHKTIIELVDVPTDDKKQLGIRSDNESSFFSKTDELSIDIAHLLPGQRLPEWDVISSGPEGRRYHTEYTTEGVRIPRLFVGRTDFSRRAVFGPFSQGDIKNGLSCASLQERYELLSQIDSDLQGFGIDVRAADRPTRLGRGVLAVELTLLD